MNLSMRRHFQCSTLRILLSVFCASLLCTMKGQEFLNLQADIQLQPASNINSKHLEYAPIYYGPGIVFVHAKEQSEWIDRKLGMPFFELMYSELDPDGMPGKSRSFSATIRTRFHEGPTAFSNDETQVYFTRSNTSNGQNVVGADKRTNLKIYVADKGPEDWMNPREMPFCSDDYSVQSPTLSPDNQQIVFMSDMPGGFGGWDLYISDRYSGAWSTPVNLGPAINTPKNERFPFWHEKNVLFFSSDGHPGQGGLDMFAALLQEDGVFSAPVNLGPKFNSRKDDLSFICDVEGTSGFFASSRREGLGKDDIYAFRSVPSIFSTFLLETPVVDMVLKARDANSLVPVAGAAVWVFPVGPLGPEGLTEYFEKSTVATDSTEILVFNLRSDVDITSVLHSDVKGSIPLKLDPASKYFIILLADEYQPQELSLLPSSIEKGGEMYIDLHRKLEMPATPNKDCLPAGALVLSKTRELPLTKVLVQVRSTCTGTIQVMETDAKGRFRTCLVPGCGYEVRLLKNGYLEQYYRYVPGTDPDDRTIYLAEVDLEARTMGPPVPGDVLVLDHIYYDFNKSAIRTGDAGELESLANMMLKYPAMTIELESHTDARGAADYNMELSQRRGESVLEFLSARGVSANRVSLKPMGESQLRNHCADGVPCTEEEHQLNRRTEIRILTVDPHVEIHYPDQE